MDIGLPVTSSCSREHQKIYQEWFAMADSDGDGRITGNDAIRFFGMSKLTCSELKQVWAISESKRQGFLDFNEFIIAMQLIALGQAGNEITADILNNIDIQSLKPPQMDGLDVLLAKNRPSPKKSALDFDVAPPAQVLSSVQLFNSKSTKKIPLSSVTSIIDGLKILYMEKLKPLEVTYHFNEFVSPSLTNSDFDAKPMVMLLGQNSTVKTTFIKHLLRTNYPGAHIGPEPTTDRFVVVMYGPDERSIPGNIIAVQADMPFSGVTAFGTAFLSKFQCSQMPHSLLEQITFVDTPGILSGEKQQTQQSYDFIGVTSWFAAKCDLIILLFDPHIPDISDEFQHLISSLRKHKYKIRVFLNMADQIDSQQLMRVHGALVVSLGRALNTREVIRVYIGSVNDEPVNEATVGPIGKDLYDLLSDIKDVPNNACDHKISGFVKRAMAAKIHAYIIGHLKKRMPSMMGKAKAKKQLINKLEDEFIKVQKERRLPPGDFPSVDHYREKLSGYKFDKFEKLKPEMIQVVDDMFEYDIPKLLTSFKNPYE